MIFFFGFYRREVIKKERVMQVCSELIFRGHLFHINHDYAEGFIFF